MEATALPAFRQMLTEAGRAVTCLIVDGVFSFATDVAKFIEVPLLYFDTISPCGLWSFLCLPRLIQAGEFPFQDDNLDKLLTNMECMDGIIRRRDLPSFYRTGDLHDRTIQLVLGEADNIPRAQGLIFNTFQHLEAPVLSQMLNVCPNIYAVGPLHAHLRTRLELAIGSELSEPVVTSNSIWKEDKSCISWLDQQPPRSVVYVSFGSLAVMTKDQLLEIWHGLVNSGSRFLWVRRPGSVSGPDDPDLDPDRLGLSQGTKERGCMVNWAPQQEVLAHSAVGGFLTHSGWNSTLESIVEGKPMICWPSHADQQVNSRYVEHVWKIGVDMKDCCNRETVERKIKEVMKFRNEELFCRVEEMGKLAKLSVSEGGSSFMDMDRLIEDIKMMKIKIK